MNRPESKKKYITVTSIKEIKGWSRDGRAKKYTNKICRDNHIHYTSLHLLFSIITHLLSLIWIPIWEADTKSSDSMLVVSLSLLDSIILHVGRNPIIITSEGDNQQWLPSLLHPLIFLYLYVTVTCAQGTPNRVCVRSRHMALLI